MEIDYKKLKGEALFHYFTHDHTDKEYRSVVSLLPYAVSDFNKAIILLEKAVREDRQFIAIYPGIEKTDTSEMEYVGSIPDGELYMK